MAGGTEEEAAETYCDSNRSALSVVTGIDGSSGAMSSMSDATTRGRTTVPAASGLFDNPRQQQEQQHQRQQRLELDALASRGCVDCTRPVSSRESVPRRRSPVPVKVVGSSPVLSNSRTPMAPQNSTSRTSEVRVSPQQDVIIGSIAARTLPTGQLPVIPVIPHKVSTNRSL